MSTLLTMIGSAGAVGALSQLGRSFSIMAVTPKLVTTGPHRFGRHPLYLAEEIAMVGVFMQFASIYTTLLLAVQIAFSRSAYAQRGTGPDCPLPRVRRRPAEHASPASRDLLT